MRRKALSPPAAPPEPLPPACLNCGEPYASWHPQRHPRYCPVCGQETAVRPPRLGEFIQQFGGAYFSTEGALWRTLALLLVRPGELTRRYLAGRRRHYLLPLRLYLTISVLVLLVMRAVAGMSEVKALDLDLGKTDLVIVGFGQERGIGIKNGVFFCTDAPEWLCKRLRQRLDVDAAGLRREVGQFGDRLLSNLGAAMFIALPAFALWHRIVYWNRRLRYTEHLVYALHLHAFWFVALLAMLSPWKLLADAAALSLPLYTLWAMKRVYGGRWWPLLLRAATVSLLYLLTLALALMAVALWSVVF